MGNIFYQDFRDFIEELNKYEVEYLLVGGYSVIFHGYSRTTGDMDLWVNCKEENYNKLLLSFKQFGLSTFEMTKENFLNVEKYDVFTFGNPPVCIDIMTKVKGLNFEEAYKKAVIFEDDNLKIKVISYNDLIEAKKSSNRLKDIDDINNLNK